MSDPLFIAVTPETHALFTARQDRLGVGSDSYVRRLIEADDCLRRIVAVAEANGNGAIGASFARELAELHTETAA